MAKARKRKRKSKKIKLTSKKIHEHIRKLSRFYLVLGLALFLLSGATILFSLSSADSTFSGSSRTTRKSWTKTDSWQYFHPRWNEESFWSFLAGEEDTPKEKVKSAHANFQNIINDPKKKIEPIFQVPGYLADRVLFWIDVYARYDSRIRVIHDRDNLGLVYGYIDFRPIYRTHRSSLLARKKVRKIEKEILVRLNSLLHSVANSVYTPRKLPDETASLRKYLGSRGALKKVSSLKKNIRTQTGQKDKFQIAILRSSKLLPMIESVFRRRNLPIGLTRIPFVESSFNARARSKVSAMGLWQMMPATATEMIHPWKQELWMDPIRQTKAAARLLQMYKKLLPDWGTTVTAYNSGVGNLRKLLKKYKARNYESLYKKMGKGGLGFAGKNFYAEFLAANLVEAYKENIYTLMISPTDVTRIFDGLNPFEKEICKKRK